MHTRHSQLSRATQISAAALVLFATSLCAQGGGAGGFVGGARGSGGAVVAREHATIPAQTVRALVAAHHPDVGNGTSEDNILTLMIDSNGNYVGSASSKANIISASAGGARGAGGGAGGAGGGGGFITAAPAGAVARGGGGGGATAVATASAEPGKLNFVGIGTVDASLVQDMFWTNYEAGEVSANALRVRFVILKSGVPK